MSSSKRRKLDSVPGSPNPVSAMSALAARRRLGAGTAETTQPNSPSTPGSSSSGTLNSSNAFSILQGLSRQGNSTNSPTPAQPKTPQELKRSSRPPKAAETRGSDITSTPSSKSTQYSSFRETKQNHRVSSRGVVLLRLNESERFLVLGSFGITVIEGGITVAGASLRPSKDIYWVHAPHCQAIPVLRTKEATKLELHGDPNFVSLRQLSRLSPLFRRIWNDPAESVGSKLPTATFRILYTSDDAPKKSIIQDLVSPPAWNKKLAASVGFQSGRQSYSTLVCGPKSAGKSTFSRLLANRLLTKTVSDTQGVMILDLDPGQTEFAAPGTLSLVHLTKPNLSAPFTHACFKNEAANIIRCHALAGISPASDPELFRECAFNLYDEYLATFRHLPLIINTPGWILGTGLELLEVLIKRTTPTETIYMSEDGPSDTVEALQAAAGDSFLTLPSQQSEFVTRTAAHLRAMHTMSYFHLTSQAGPGPSQRLQWNPSPLSSVTPLRVTYTGLNSGIRAIISYDYQSPPDLLAETINGMVLAAVEIEDSKAYRSLDSQTSSGPTIARSPEGLPYIPNPNDIALDPRYCHTIGLVLIRGIDSASSTLQIITPIPLPDIERSQKLGRHIVLLHGKFDPPSWVYTEELHLRSGEADTADQAIEVEEQDTSEDDSEDEGLAAVATRDISTTPWVETLRGNEKRPVGSKVWRVRRDLGRNAGEG